MRLVFEDVEKCLSFLVSHLDYFLDSPEEYGYSILRNVSLAYNDTLGKTQCCSGFQIEEIQVP
jgi:hypothetical protein